MNIMQQLIFEVSRKIENYENQASESAANFNLFQILKLEKNEVRTHSAFLSALFANGTNTHGYKNDFLSKFIQQQKKSKSDNINFINRLNNFNENSDYSVTAEYYIGNISENGSEGGRVDIIITDTNNNSIIIENKIDAGDQDKQLMRYNSWDKNAPIFYLTLFGKKPFHDSVGSLIEGDNYLCISYKDDIVPWLNECISISENQNIKIPILHYRNLIKNLTGTSIYNTMNNEIVKLFSTSENIKVARLINENWSNIKRKIISDLFKLESFNNIDKFRYDEENILASFPISGNSNYCIITFWEDYEFNRLQLRIENIGNTRDENLENEFRNKLTQCGYFMNPYLPKDENSRNKFVWAFFVKDWADTPWEGITSELANKLIELIEKINCALSQD